MSISDDLGLGEDRVIAVAGAGGKTSLIKALGLALAQEGKRVLATTTTKVAASEFLAHDRLTPSHLGDLGLNVNRSLKQIGRADSRANPEPFNGSGFFRSALDSWRCGTRIDSDRAPFFLYRKATDDGAKWIGLAPEAVDELAKSRKFDVILVEADGSRRCPLKAPAAHEPVIPSCADGLILVAGLSGFGRPLGEEAVFRSDLWAAITGAGFNDPVTPDDWWRVATDPRGYGRVLNPGRRNLMFLNQDDAPGAEEVFGQLTDLMQQEKGRFDGLAMGRLRPAPVLSRTWFDRQTISL
ncbi:MAG: putative selenium-dependent hydroxylase accessory protein YqeC [Rhodospirillales bacterium]|nr:putative selenium-dependent hydroxylase accessory protein YqeC [Rhodospirillales bacterium]